MRKNCFTLLLYVSNSKRTSSLDNVKQYIQFQLITFTYGEEIKPGISFFHNVVKCWFEFEMKLELLLSSPPRLLWIITKWCLRNFSLCTRFKSRIIRNFYGFVVRDFLLERSSCHQRFVSLRQFWNLYLRFHCFKACTISKTTFFRLPRNFLSVQKIVLNLPKKSFFLLLLGKTYGFGCGVAIKFIIASHFRSLC